MPTIRVTVLRNGEPVSGHRVVFESPDGMSDAQYTGTDGIATYEAGYGEEGTVFVDGARTERWGSYSATDITVEL